MLFSDQGECTGIKGADGSEIKAEKVLLCTSAWTAQFLADSGAQNKGLQVKSRMVAAAATSCIVQCDPEYQHLYRDAPVHFLGMPHTHDQCSAWSKAKTSSADGKLKFNFEISFTNNEMHEASGQISSVPPRRVTQTTWSHDVPEKLKQSVRKVVDRVYGKNAPGLTIESYRMGWSV